MNAYMVIVGALALSSCAAARPVLDPSLRPPQSSYVVAVIDSAEQCASPATATVPGPNLKYGCFCGKGHPTIHFESAGSKSKDEVLMRYYSIAPIDSIDEACRDHDVCWALHGDGTVKCDKEFSDRLQYIGKQMPYRNKCSTLTSNMTAAFLTPATASHSEDSGEAFGAAGAKLLVAPFLLIPAVFFAPAWLFGEAYPPEGHLCNPR